MDVNCELLFEENIINQYHDSDRFVVKKDFSSMEVLLYGFHQIKQFYINSSHEFALRLRRKTCFFINSNFNLGAGKLVKFIFPVEIQVIGKQGISDECFPGL